MTGIDWVSISGIVVDVILFFIIAGNAVFGYRRGLARVICSLLSTIIAIVLVIILYRPVTNYIINNTNISSKLENIFEEKLSYLFEKENVDINNVEQIQKNKEIYGILNVFIGDELGDLIQDTTNNLIKYFSVQISHKVIKVLTFFILFAVIRLFLYVIRNYIEMVANIPIIRVFNGVGGMIYGILKGFLIIYVTLAILSLIMPIISDTLIITSIQNSLIGSKMFNNNILLNLIIKK